MAEYHRGSGEGDIFSSLTPPFLKLGCLGRQSALWWRSFGLPSHSRRALRQFMPRRTRDPSNTPSSSLSRERTLLLGYTLQFGCNPPRCDGVHQTVVSSASKASVLQQELSSLLLKGGNRGSPSIGSGTRLFQPLFPCAKEGRRFTTHSRSTSYEPLPLQREVQDVDVEDYYASDLSGRLVRHC